MEMTLAEMIAELPYESPGELSCRHLDGREPKSVIYDCCEELERLQDKIEFVSWSHLAANEGVGEDYHRGRDRILDEIRSQIEVIRELIRKATGELAGSVQS